MFHLLDGDSEFFEIVAGFWFDFLMAYQPSRVI